MPSLAKPGMVLDRVQLISRLDQGGQAFIWRVRETEGSRELACKLLAFPFAQRNQPEIKAKIDIIEREIEILRDISHRFVAKVLYPVGGQVDDEGNSIYCRGFVLEHAPIGTLARVLMTEGRPAAESLTAEEATRIMSQLTDAVVHLHDMGIVHSDIKADNILLTVQATRLTPLIIDFGAAFRAHEPWPGFMTEAYAAPELRTRRGSATKETDIYALGVLFTELISGRKLHQPDEKTVDGLSISSIYEEYIPLLKRMLARTEDARPTSTELVSALERRRAVFTAAASRVKDSLAFPWGAYRWNPRTHYALGCGKEFIFLRGSRPTAEGNLLSSTLEKGGIYGATIRRLLGNYDFMVEVWISDDQKDALVDACRKFLIEHTSSGTVPKSYSCELVRCGWNRQLKTAKKTKEEILAEVHKLAVKSLKGGTEQLLKLGYIVNGKPKNEDGIGFFLEIKSAHPLTEGGREYYGMLMYEYIATKLSDKLRRQLWVFSASDASGFLISMIVPGITVYRDIMLGIARHLRKKATNEADKFGFNTHIDMDGDGFIVSDDGSIPTLLLKGFT